MELKKVIDDQQKLGENIHKLSINFSKDGKKRKTEKYLEERIEKLTDYSAHFEENHRILLDAGDSGESKEYFDNNYYVNIMAISNDLMEKLLSLKKEKTKGEESSEDDNDDEDGKESTEKTQTIYKNNEWPQTVRKYEIREAILQRAIDRETRSDIDEFKMKQKSLEIYWQKLEETYEELMLCQMTEEEERYYDERYTDLDNVVRDEKIQLEKKIREGQLKKQENVEAVKLNLKAIDVPKFQGEYGDWMSFYDIYKTLVHENKSLAEVQKMQYLKSSLGGEAQKLIQHLNLARDYEAAWKILEDRYHNKRILLTTLIDAILNAKGTENTAASVRRLHDTLKECLCGIKNLGYNTDEWSPILMVIILKKMDKTTHSLFERTMNQPRELPKMEKLLEFLDTQFQTLEVENGNEQISHINRPGGYNWRPNKAIGKTTSFENCKICNEPHRIHGCKRYNGMLPEERREALRRAKLCANCLGQGHEAA